MISISRVTHMSGIDRRLAEGDADAGRAGRRAPPGRRRRGGAVHTPSTRSPPGSAPRGCAPREARRRRSRRRGRARAGADPRPGRRRRSARSHGRASVATVKQPDRAEADHHSGSPGCRRARSTPWIATDSGSTRHACSSARPSGSRWSSDAGAATRSANPPSRANPMPAVSAIAQRYDAPLRQSSQTPHGILGSMTAASPASPAGDPVADGLDDAGELVAGNGVGEQPDLVRGEIRAADAAAVDADHHLPGHCLGDRESPRARGDAPRRA